MSEREARRERETAEKEFLLGLSSERLTRVEHALDRNWTVQLVLAGVGIALVFDVGDLPRFLSRYAMQQEYDLRPVAAVLIAVQLYHFMKLGHLLTAFVEARRLNQDLLDEYLANSSSGERSKKLGETTSFFEGYYSPDAFGRGPLRVAYYLTAVVTVSTGQATALFLVLKAYGVNVWSVSVVALSAVAMGILYGGFWRSKRNHPGTTAIAMASALGALLLLLAFCVMLNFSVMIEPSPVGATREEPGL